MSHGMKIFVGRQNTTASVQNFNVPYLFNQTPLCLIFLILPARSFSLLSPVLFAPLRSQLASAQSSSLSPKMVCKKVVPYPSTQLQLPPKELSSHVVLVRLLFYRLFMCLRCNSEANFSATFGDWFHNCIRIGLHAWESRWSRECERTGSHGWRAEWSGASDGCKSPATSAQRQASIVSGGLCVCMAVGGFIHWPEGASSRSCSPFPFFITFCMIVTNESWCKISIERNKYCC